MSTMLTRSTTKIETTKIETTKIETTPTIKLETTPIVKLETIFGSEFSNKEEVVLTEEGKLLTIRNIHYLPDSKVAGMINYKRKIDQYIEIVDDSRKRRILKRSSKRLDNYIIDELMIIYNKEFPKN